MLINFIFNKQILIFNKIDRIENKINFNQLILLEIKILNKSI